MPNWSWSTPWIPSRRVLSSVLCHRRRAGRIFPTYQEEKKPLVLSPWSSLCTFLRFRGLTTFTVRNNLTDIVHLSCICSRHPFTSWTRLMPHLTSGTSPSLPTTSKIGPRTPSLSSSPFEIICTSSSFFPFLYNAEP